MKVALFSAKNYDQASFHAANTSRHEIHFFDPHLNEQTAIYQEEEEISLKTDPVSSFLMTCSRGC